ncbi:MAG: hypothetical protein JXR76_06330 [Deltaproteobacteria bacterium]|nr:hypothetical protein [Deltaproteobacteria bacterium]
MLITKYIRCTRIWLMLIAFGLPGCLCSEKLSDEERLLRRVDSSKVHLYVATKVAITKVDADPKVAKAKQQLMKLIGTWSTTAKPRQPVAPSESSGDSDASVKENSDAQISPGELLTIGRHLWNLKQTGADIVRGEGEDTLLPALPVLLKAAGANGPLVERINMPTEHALFYLVFSILKFHKTSPVPIPEEILLYEAWHTDPEKISFAGLAPAFHALKAWTYGANDFCDLSAKEADAAAAKPLNDAQLMSDLQMLSLANDEQTLENAQQISAAISAVGFGSTALCHLSRGDDRLARPFVRKFIDYGAKTNVMPTADVILLEAFYECGGDNDAVQSGLKRLKKFASHNPLEKETVEALQAYCEANEKTQVDAARKLLFAGKMLELTTRVATQHNMGEKMENTALFRVISGFAHTLQKTALSVDGVGRAAKGVKNLLSKNSDE